MVLRSFSFSSMKTVRFYLLQNQSSAASSQPVAAFWCSGPTQTCEIPAVFALFHTFMKLNTEFVQHARTSHDVEISLQNRNDAGENGFVGTHLRLNFRLCELCGFFFTFFAVKSFLVGTRLRVELFAQQLIHNLRIRLPFRGLHHLPDEKSDDRLLPGPILLNLLWICGDQFIDDLLQC
jgi:hypothetical protein